MSSGEFSRLYSRILGMKMQGGIRYLGLKAKLESACASFVSFPKLSIDPNLTPSLVEDIESSSIL